MSELNILMKFILNDKYRKNYLEEALKIAKTTPGDQATLDYFSKNNLESNLERGEFEDCYDYAFNKLGIGFTGYFGSGISGASKFIKNSGIFNEIKSEKEILENQLIAYYFYEKEYLHVGIISEIKDTIPIISSQWGGTLEIKHPIYIGNKKYGHKYKIFTVDRKEYLIQKEKEEPTINAEHTNLFKRIRKILPNSSYSY